MPRHRYRKRPIEIWAIQWDGTRERFNELRAFCGDDLLTTKLVENQEPGPLSVKTLEGAVWAEVDDWIIRGVEGEFYPCKPSIFATTYERVSP